MFPVLGMGKVPELLMDHELEVINAIVDRLVKLGPIQRKRVMTYLLERFAHDLPERKN
jgi:hypothetical protein